MSMIHAIFRSRHAGWSDNGMPVSHTDILLLRHPGFAKANTGISYNKFHLHVIPAEVIAECRYLIGHIHKLLP